MGKIVSLDIGGTNTRVALVNEKHEIESIHVAPTVVGNVELFLASVKKDIEDALTSWNDVKAIAVGVPGRVRYDGFIYALPNIHVDNIPLAPYLFTAFHIPAFVINDAEAASLAEANVGKFKSCHSVYFVTISTGIGGALCVDGKLRGSSYEVGHTMTEYRGQIHEFEHLASGSGIVRLCDQNGFSVASSREFFQLVRNGHEAAEGIYRDWIRLMADWLEMNQRNFQPDVFTITGGVAKNSGLFLPDLRKAAPDCRLELCSCGEQAGLIGAAVLGFQKTKG
ncbi:MAG: ROK family protein [Bacilli bacterium]|jgi:glucokinase|nr:ROK family protein [Bacilli bacterium]